MYIFYALAFEKIPNSSLLATIFIGTLFTYSFLLYKRLKQSYFLAVIIICLFLFPKLLPMLKLEQTIAFGSMFLITILYNVPFIEKRQLREIPYLKPFIIASIWAYIGAGFLKLAPIIMLEAFFYIFPLAMLFDYRDQDIDRGHGLITFATRFSSRTFKSITICTFLIHVTLEAYLLKSWVFTSIQLTLFFIVIAILKKERSREFYTLGVDGLILGRPFIFIFLQQAGLL